MTTPARIIQLSNGQFVAQFDVSGRIIECPMDDDYAYGDPDPEFDEDLLYFMQSEWALLVCDDLPVTGDDEWGPRFNCPAEVHECREES